jgi:hypothetical protein
MKILDYLDGVISLNPWLVHPRLKVVLVKENLNYRAMFYKIDKINETGINLFRLRYEYQQNTNQKIHLKLLLGRCIRVLDSPSSIKNELERLGYTVEFI